MEKSFILRWYKGRIDRARYALGLLATAVCFFFPLLIIENVQSPVLGGIFALCYFAVLVFFAIFFISLHVRRLHDLGWNGWWWLVIFFAPAGVVLLLILLLQKSQQKENQYGSTVSSGQIFDTIFNKSNGYAEASAGSRETR